MKNTIHRHLLAALFTVSISTASMIDVTNTSQVTLGTNDSLIFTLSADYATCRDAQYPGAIQLILGSMPLGGPVASIPGTSGVYMPGIVFSGAIVSGNSSLAVPLYDPDAARVGLPAGDLLLTPGSRSGSSYSGPIDLLSAGATLTSPEAAALFSSGEVEIEIRNLGSPVTFGYSGVPITNDFTGSWVSSSGAESIGARVMQVQCVHAPEPGTTGLLLIGAVVIAARLRTARTLRRPGSQPAARA